MTEPDRLNSEPAKAPQTRAEYVAEMMTFDRTSGFPTIYSDTETEELYGLQYDYHKASRDHEAGKITDEEFRSFERTMNDRIRQINVGAQERQQMKTR